MMRDLLLPASGTPDRFRCRLGQVVLSLVLALLLPVSSMAHPPDDDHAHHAKADSGTKHGSLAETGAKLSNPVSDVWALFTEFDLTLNNGSATDGNDDVGSLMNFQPILPIPVYGEGEDRWQMLLRPAVPILFASPRPDPPNNNVNYDGGIADILFPALLTPPQSMTGSNLIFGIGPTLAIPTASKVQLGRRQWQLGPAAVLGWKTKDYVFGVFPQYFFGVGGRGDQGSGPGGADIENASNMNLLYFGFLNLPNAWQVGMNPVITYDHKAGRGNKWNVPIGLVVAKTTKMGKMPVKFQFGVEYSVVSQDDYGKRALFKLNIIPVIGALVKSPIFGGD